MSRRSVRDHGHLLVSGEIDNPTHQRRGESGFERTGPRSGDEDLRHTVEPRKPDRRVGDVVSLQDPRFNLQSPGKI